jgi:hypothetical protein
MDGMAMRRELKLLPYVFANHATIPFGQYSDSRIFDTHIQQIAPVSSKSCRYPENHASIPFDQSPKLPALCLQKSYHYPYRSGEAYFGHLAFSGTKQS